MTDLLSVRIEMVEVVVSSAGNGQEFYSTGTRPVNFVGFFSICFEQSYEFDTLENLWRITEGVAQMLFDRISKRIQTIAMSIMSQVLE